MAPDTTPAWGMTPLDGDRWRLGLWAPSARAVVVQVAGADIAASRRHDGWFTAEVSAPPGTPYALRVDGQPTVDPAARRVDVAGTGLRGILALPPRRPAPAPARPWAEYVILEVHIGTFTDAGTFAAAAARMAGIAALGITAIEIMPVAAFPGRHGWGYDGILPFAPHPAYGTAQDLADLVGAIHAAGMSAILDVVYNHFGPEGAPLAATTPEFFDAHRASPWGPAIDFTRAPVRDFFLDNAAMWVRDFGFDALRLDAVHQIVDPSPRHLVTEMAGRLAQAVPDRAPLLIAEDDRNLPHHREDGSAVAAWNDDYHHALHCLLTGEDWGYYAAFAVDPLADLCRALAEGHVEQGQDRPGKEAARGAPSSHLPVTAFVNFNQNHDQIGNRGRGERLLALADPACVRVAHALLLCGPAIPLMFMGEEAGARAPFPFFVDFHGDLAEAVRKGRAEEFAGLDSLGAGGTLDPVAPGTFAVARPHADPAPDAEDWRALTRTCLAFRAAQVVPLVATGRRAAAGVRATGPRSLHALWHFHGGTLEAVAHFGALPDTPVTLTGAAVTLGAPDAPVHFAAKVRPA